MGMGAQSGLAAMCVEGKEGGRGRVRGRDHHAMGVRDRVKEGQSRSTDDFRASWVADAVGPLALPSASGCSHE